MILDYGHRYTHPVTGEVYGRTDYDDPAKLAEIGAFLLTMHVPAEGMSADGWEIVQVGDGYVRRPTGETPIPAKPQEPPPESVVVAPSQTASTTFSKLKIRRAMRRLGIEGQLDALLSASALFEHDWADALEIDLQDPITVEALGAANIDIDAVIAEIRNGG
jgi:hypothetical protein